MAMNSVQQTGAPGPQGQNFTPASLYVGELLPDVTEAILFEMFNSVGPVASIRVCRDVVSRRSLGYAYVNFHSVTDAERALDTMNFSMIRGRVCRIMWSQRDPSLRKSGVGNIFVKNLDKSIDHKTLYDTFSMFGSILSCKVATNETGESLGYGFVHYESQESADRAIQKVDGMVIAAREVHVKPFLPKSQRTGPNDAKSFTNVYVKGFDRDSIDETKFREMFEKFGGINSIHLERDAEGKPRGFGFVNYGEPEQASAAIEALNGNEGLTVCRAQKKEERHRQLRENFEKLCLQKAEKYAGVNLYIKNLDDSIDDGALEVEFASYGKIESTKVMRTPDGRSKGFGFVMFASRDAAAKAVAEMNGKMLKQKPLYVALAQRKEERRQYLEAQAQASRNNKMQPMPHQMYGHPQGPGGAPHPGMYFQGGPQGMPQGPGPQHGMPPGTPMGVAPQMPRGGAQTPQGFMYGPPQHQMGGMNDPRAAQGGMGPQGGRGGPWGPGPRTPNGGPNGMMMNQRGPGPNMYMMGGGMQQGGRGMGGGRGRGRGGGGRGGGGDRIQFQHNVRNNPQQQGGPQQQQAAVPPQQQPNGVSALPAQQQQAAPNAGGAQQPNAAAGVAPTPTQQAPAGPVAPPGPLTSQALARAPAQQQKQMIGERIYPKIQEIEPGLAGKITGMLLEMDNTELLHLLESPEALQGKISEAMTVLQHSGDAPSAAAIAAVTKPGAAAAAAAASGDAAAAPAEQGAAAAAAPEKAAEGAAAAAASSGDDAAAPAAVAAAAGDA